MAVDLVVTCGRTARRCRRPCAVMARVLHDQLTEQIIGAFYEVHRELGHGFVESVYERSMMIALRNRGLFVQRQVPVVVHYLGEPVGTFCADLVVERTVI